jgi:hypothetical protein
MPETIQTTEEFRDEIRGLFRTMSENIGSMAHDMGSLRIAVVGDQLMGTTGLVRRMEDAERRRDVDRDACEKEMQKLRDDFKDEKARIDKKLAWINGVGALASIIFAVVLALIEGGHFFGH